MKLATASILAGVAALALAGSAYAGAQGLHRMTVKTPDGGVATIEYSGDVAPRVTIGEAPMRTGAFGAAAPFAAFDRISAAMNREMDVLLRQANMMALPFASVDPLFDATLNAAPAGHAQGWFARAGTSGFCMRSVEITQSGNARPHVVSHSAGNCAAGGGPANAVSRTIPRNGEGMLQAVGKAPKRHRLPMFYEAGYKPH